MLHFQQKFTFACKWIYAKTLKVAATLKLQNIQRIHLSQNSAKLKILSTALFTRSPNISFLILVVILIMVSRTDEVPSEDQRDVHKKYIYMAKRDCTLMVIVLAVDLLLLYIYVERTWKSMSCLEKIEE